MRFPRRRKKNPPLGWFNCADSKVREEGALPIFSFFYFFRKLGKLGGNLGRRRRRKLIERGSVWLCNFGNGSEKKKELLFFPIALCFPEKNTHTQNVASLLSVLLVLWILPRLSLLFFMGVNTKADFFLLQSEFLQNFETLSLCLSLYPSVPATNRRKFHL